jgi:hypothetical protein
MFVFDVTHKTSKTDFSDFNDWYERAGKLFYVYVHLYIYTLFIHLYIHVCMYINVSIPRYVYINTWVDL